jgi:hypothetical protein
MSRNCLNIDRIAFFGRTYAEYVDMFGLDESVMKQGRILDCPAGASSLAAESHRLGLDVIGCDILYGMSAHDLYEKGRNDIQHVFEKFDEAEKLYVWKYYKNKNEVMALRTKALELFIEDFGIGFKEGRYVRAELPRLPFLETEKIKAEITEVPFEFQKGANQVMRIGCL